VIDNYEKLSVEFRSARIRLFKKMPCQIFLDICLERPKATVEKVTCNRKANGDLYSWIPL